MSPATSGIDCTSDPSQGPNGTQKGHFRSGFGDGDGSVEDVTVRPATADDLPAVLTLKNASWRETYAHVLDAALLDRLDARLDEQVERAGDEHGAVTRGAVALDPRGLPGGRGPPHAPRGPRHRRVRQHAGARPQRVPHVVVVGGEAEYAQCPHRPTARRDPPRDPLARMSCS